MKIAMIGHKRIPSREGGVEIVVEELTTRLVALGHKVVAYNRKGKNVQDNNADKEKRKLKEYKGVKLISVPTINKKGIDALLYSFFATIMALFGRYDVIHYHAEGPCAMLWIPHLFGIKTVATIHGLDWQRSKWGGFATKYIKFGEKIAAKYADEIIVLSKGVQKYFKETYNRETTFIPNGVNKPEIKEPNIIKQKWNLEKDNYVLFLARIVPEKGLHYLIDAYKQIDTEKKLVIAGGASHTNEYLDEIKEKVKDDPRIIMTGFVQGQELEELYSNCYLYCLPSDIEGMPMSLLEAMSYGCNCLVSDIEENTQVTEEYAVTFEKGNVEDLKEKLQQCLNKSDDLKQNKNEILEHISKFDWKMVVSKTGKIYEKSFNKVRILYGILSIFFLFAPTLLALDAHVKIAGTILTAVPLIIGLINILIYQKNKLLKYIAMGIVLLINLTYATNYTEHFELLKPLLIFIIILDIVENKELLKDIKQTFTQHKNILNVSIWMIGIINLILYIVGAGRSDIYSKEWNIDAFQGIYFDPNQAAYRISASIIYIIFLIKIKTNNKYLNIVLLLMFEFVLLMTGARVPTGLGIALGMIGLWHIKDDFIEEFKTHKKIFIGIGICAIILGIYVLPKTAFVDKIINESKEGSAFDNGRSSMRDAEIKYFNSRNLLNKFLGNDVMEVNKVNQKALGSMQPLWAHNDIMQVLLQFGIIMIGIYFYTLFKSMVILMKLENKMNKFIIILLYGVLLFVSFFNGLFYHPRFVISIPMLFMTYKMCDNKDNEKLKD